jgi:predicted GNAT family acetyltransferase
MVRIISFETAVEFLQAVQADLEQHEAINNLVLGICGQLVDHPERFSSPPVLKTVEEDGNRFLTAVMTPPHNLIVSGSTLTQAGAGLFVENLLREGLKIPGVIGPVDIAREIAVRWADAAGRRYQASQKLRMYELKEVLTPLPERGNLRAAGAAELELVTRWWCAARMEMFGTSDAEEDRRTAQFRIEAGDVFLWEDGEPVSMACRTRPTRTGIGVGMVFTPPLMRNRGFATACVGELSRTLLRSGWDFCTLYADLMNPTSNSIYQKIGYRPIGDFDEYEFTEKPPDS